MNPAKGVFTFYVGRMFLVRFVGLLAFFVIILQMLDLLNMSSDILEVEDNTARDLVRYVKLRAPQIVTQFTPFAALLGIVATLAGLSHSSEITVMRAAGMSVHRVLFPFGFVCAAIAVAHFFFHELVTVRAAQSLDYWVANDYAHDLPEDTGTRTNIRINFDNEFVAADSAARFGGAVLLSDVMIYAINADGLTDRVLEARTARHEDGVWRLYNIKYYNPETLEVETRPEAPWENTLDPELLFALSLKPEQTSLPELSAKIGQLRRDQADTREAMTSFLGRFAKPMSTLVMPLLGAIAGFGVHRQGVLLARAVSGSALGFTYFVVENLSLALGKLGVIPAIVGAFFPLAFFMVVGFSIILAMEN